MSDWGPTMEGRPQGLKPLFCGDGYGTAEAVPLSKAIETDAEVAA